MLAVPGSWKSLEELEENIDLEELMLILSKKRELTHQERKFTASLHDRTLGGDDEKEADSNDPFERARRNAEARLKQEIEEQQQENTSQGGYTAENDNALVALGISITKE